MKRPRSKKGETLTETLCAVLVTALACGLLVGLVEASARLERKTLQAAAALYKAVSAAEGKTAAGEAGTITVRVDGADVSLPVTFYGSSEEAAAYREGGDAP